MRALRKLAGGEGHVGIEDVPEPLPREGDAIVSVRVAGVCGTDVHIYHDRFPTSPPVTLGHEFSGVVERVGPGVDRVRPGDRVVSENNPFSCGVCALCAKGYPNLCPHKRAMGILSDGCFAARVRLPARLLHRIPEGVTFEEAALMEPLAVAVHAVWDRCGIEPGDTVVVFGAGAIGLLAAQVARAEGAEKVVVTGTPSDEAVRFKCAEGLGIETLNVADDDVTERVMALTDGTGADVVVEASGSPKAITQGIGLLRKNGRMAVAGLTGEKAISLDWDGVVARALSFFFAYSSRRCDWRKGLELLSAKKVATLPLITHRFGLEAWAEAFGVLERLEAIRPVFLMEGSG